MHCERAGANPLYVNTRYIGAHSKLELAYNITVCTVAVTNKYRKIGPLRRLGGLMPRPMKIYTMTE